MANTQVGAHTSNRFIDKRRGRNYGSVSLAEINNYPSVNSLRSRLTTISATKYSTARLDAMTVNDMVYALRVETGDVAGF